MPSNSPRRLRAALVHVALCLAALATLGFPGCPDVTGPGKVSGDYLTMSNLWPNDDGRYWTYLTDWMFLEYEVPELLPAGADVPEITFAMARALLDDPVTPSGTSNYPFRLWFAGQITTQSGVTAQNLVESIPIRTLAGGPAARSFEQRLLDQLARARPSLRARLARPAAGNDDHGALLAPNFIHGYAWIKSRSHIGTYGDVDTLLAWKFLESRVQPGHTFRHQLVPSLASDVWLLASVERVVAAELPDGKIVHNALEVLYIVDYGVEEVTDAMANVIGLFRPFDYGTVVYVPGVGPVSDHERRFGYLGQNVTHGVYDLRLTLQATGVEPPMVLARAKREP